MNSLLSAVLSLCLLLQGVVGGNGKIGGNGAMRAGTPVVGPARVHLSATCTSAAATTIPITISSTTSGNLLTVAEYNEAATQVTSTALVEVSTTVTVTSTYNPGIGNTVQVRGATPSGFDGLWVVTASNGTSFTYTNPTTGLGTASGQAVLALAPTIAAAGVTFINTEADPAYSAPRSQMAWIAQNIPASVTTVTVTLPASSTGCVAVGEYSGLNTTTALDAHCAAVSGFCGTSVNTTPWNGASLTPTASKNEVMFGSLFDQSGPNTTGTFGGASGWTVGVTAYENGGGFGSFAYYEQIVVSTSGSYAVSGTQSAGGFTANVTDPTTLNP